ncbi:MAG: hypothetical protein NUW22_01175 [Acidobacteria bacterium]|nr:hypothetical protein [Acidobacteriota bacterium]
MSTKAAQIVLGVKVTDGSYESSISIPIIANKEQRDGAVALWLSMMKQALDLHAIEAASEEQGE